MQTSLASVGHEFGGRSESNGGPQFLGNNISLNSGSINIGVNPDDKLPPKICELPVFFLSPYFTGRSDELQQIERIFSTPVGNLPKYCVIHGMPGLGKTQLALKFATLAFQNGQYSYAFWVSAESVEKLCQDVSNMVDLLCLPGRHMLNHAGKITAARRWLEDSTVAESWLVVLDNMSEETAVTTLRDFMPRENDHGRLLITTRTASIVERLTTMETPHQLALQPPSINHATAMLVAGARLDQGDREGANCTIIERLVRLVGNLPLAIDQAASYIRMSGSSPQEVLDVYNSEEVLEILSWENNLSRYEEKSVVATLTPALNWIQQNAPDAGTLLRLLCFCDPEGISINILTQGCDALQKERDALSQAQAVDKLKGVRDLFRSRLRLSKAIQDIQRLSLAAYAPESGDRIIRIHDIIHLLLRLKLMTNTEQGQWLEIAIDIICKAFEGIGHVGSPQTWSQCSRFVSHIESLEKFAAPYTFKRKELLDANTRVACYLYACGLYEKAETLTKRTLEQNITLLGRQDPSTLVNMHNLASVFNSQGKYKEAEWIHRQALALGEPVLGKAHPKTLTSKTNLAMTLARQGRYNEAEEIYRPTLAIQELILGKGHPSTLTSMAGLANILKSQGKYKDAEGMFRQTLASRNSVLGEKHPDTLISKADLAVILARQGRYNEAEEIYRPTLAVQELILGKGHPSTLISMAGLANILESQGKYEDAEGMFRRTLALRNSVLGEKHPDTLNSMNELAHVLCQQWKFDEAEALYKQTLVLNELLLGKNHPSTLYTMNGLAMIVASRGRHEEAEGMYREVTTLSEISLGKGHPTTMTSMSNLAVSYANQGLWGHAEELHMQVMETRERLLGKENLDTLQSTHWLAQTWKQQGRNKEAISLMRDCLELRNRILGPEHPDTKDSCRFLREWESEEDERRHSD